MTEETVRDEQQEQAENTDNSAGDKAFREFVRHQRIAIEELGKALESLLPKDFRTHTKNAGQSFIDAFRSLFDAAKDDLEQVMKRRNSSEDKAPDNTTKVKVEIE